MTASKRRRAMCRRFARRHVCLCYAEPVAGVTRPRFRWLRGFRRARRQGAARLEALAYLIALGGQHQAAGKSRPHYCFWGIAAMVDV